MAKERGISLAVLTAGLIEALCADAGDEDDGPSEDSSQIHGIESVRELLHPLLKQAHEGLQQGKIAFVEAATGTGKGRMLAALAADAAAAGQQVVVSAPLSVTWQLVDDLSQLPGSLPAIDLLLGRPNFVDPESVRGWAQDNSHGELLDWVEAGGPALSARTQNIAKLTGKALSWLLEDALSLAEGLPVSTVMLSGDSGKECPAEGLYRTLKSTENRSQQGILLCSHHMLASHVRHAAFNRDADDDPASGIPSKIDTLLVDEAHQLEAAFAAIFSHAIHFRSLIRTIQSSVKVNKKPALLALEVMEHEITERILPTNQSATSASGWPSEYPDITDTMKRAEDALCAIKTKNLNAHATSAIRAAIGAFRAALSGRSMLRFEVSPVRRYPGLTVGRSNLEGATADLWDSVGSAALCSATLFAGDSANLTRWKLGVDVARALYCRPVHPPWTWKPVVLHSERTSVDADDSAEWAQSASEQIHRIAARAAGGTLVLCTSHDNVRQLSDSLSDNLAGRLIAQHPGTSARGCAMQFDALYRSGLKPVWIGVGAAWTGISLSDTEALAHEDNMLSDLVITRLPIGLNRSLTHDRRVKIGGFGIVAQEALWQLRQGIGRLVRREGLPDKHLWVLDPRLDSSKPWVERFNRLLSKYKKA
ncbi:MAG: DEAD/DEAH box helicase family protein [Natronospirillum sp.]|uniref:helicase C-terminal domain-containing protein n=1 Tax=Natronospirillum sp. TaxID=2812955 RepID=UPI0025E7C66C|nr:helicase C-terminal domain-containing protein [Natronospirillum sp.]MCH8552941.1 DEAD/DEAH box helicase family protein [Natronospirillum sp.]